MTDHAFIKKWGVLEKIGVDQKNIVAGYLQVDLAIISNSELPTPATMVTHNDDIIEEYVDMYLILCLRLFIYFFIQQKFIAS